MRTRSRKKHLIFRKRFYKRLFILTLFIILVAVFIFIKCSRNYIFTICIDAGHGGYDSGATNEIYKVDEKDLVLDISLQLGEILDQQNVKIIYTRKKDRIPWKNQIESLKGRSDISNKANADIFVSIHGNSFIEDKEVRGSEVWCRFKDTEDEILAREIGNRLSSIGYTKDRGIKYEEDKELYVLKNTQAVSVLIELGYLSNQQDLEFLISEEGKKQCAEAIAEGIMNYYYSTKAD